MATKPKNAESNVTPELIAEALATYTEDKGEHSRTGLKLARNQKAYEKEGVSAKLIRQMFREMDLTADERAADYQDERRYRQALNMIQFEANGQGSFAAAIETPAGTDHMMRIDEGKAFDEGHSAGMKRNGAMNRFLVGSAEHAAFARGEKEGLAERSASDKPKRGRPRKTPATGLLETPEGAEQRIAAGLHDRISG